MHQAIRRMSASLIVAVASAATAAPEPAPALSVAEIVKKNIAAKGGLEAWRAVKAMSLSGKMGAGGNQRASLQVPTQAQATVVARKTGEEAQLPSRRVEEIYLPFVMDLARPGRMRFELQVAGQSAVQVYDGRNGWKLRPYLNRSDAEPYTTEEARIASVQSELDGLLVDYAAKGTRIEADGTERVEGRDTYKLKLTLKSGDVTHVWLDAQTFLETRIEGQPRQLDGTSHPVEVYYRDYRSVNGLKIPFLLETRVLPVEKTALGLRDTPVPPEKVLIEKVVINPKFDAGLFSKPAMATSAAMPKKS